MKEKKNWRQDSENEGIISFIDEEEEPFLTASEIIRQNYLNVMRSRRIDDRINKMIELVTQAIAFFDEVPEDWHRNLEEIDLLVSLSGGKRTTLLVNKRLHYKLSILLSKITQRFYAEKKIIDKPIRVENIVRAVDGGSEGIGPAPQEFSLLKAYEDEERKELKKLKGIGSQENEEI